LGSRLMRAWRELALGLDDGPGVAARAESSPAGLGVLQRRCLAVRMGLVAFVATGWLIAVVAGLATVLIGPIGSISSPAALAMLVLSATWLGLGGVAALPVLDHLIRQWHTEHLPTESTTHPGVPR
jgi:hypothetical protein